MTIPTVTVRPFAGDDDIWAVRAFLAALHALTPPGRTWDVRRWDASCFYAAEPGVDAARAARTRIWATPDGRIVAALLSEGDRELHPNVHPDVRDREGEVIATGERVASDLGDESVVVLCYEHDVERRRVLEGRGYERTDRWAVIRQLRLGDAPLPEPRLAAGYRMRTTRPADDDHQRLADLLNAAFRRDCHHAGETRGFQARAPSFRRALDLVAEAPDGTFAAYAAVCWDDTNRRGIFEPVCTHPAHRQHGLAKALMLEGVHRARALGAASVSVETGDMDAANALYDAIGFAERYQGHYWRKAVACGAD
jgi:mycothiol synthase